MPNSSNSSTNMESRIKSRWSSSSTLITAPMEAAALR
jgi:hypothetical protein